MARWATQKGMKKVRCSSFSVVPFSNLIRPRRMNTERILVGVPHGALRHPEIDENPNETRQCFFPEVGREVVCQWCGKARAGVWPGHCLEPEIVALGSV